MTPQEHMAMAVRIMGTLESVPVDASLADRRSFAIQEAQVHALIGLGGLIASSLEEIKVRLNPLRP